MAFFDYNIKETLRHYSFGSYLRRSSEDNEDKQVRSLEGQQLDLEEVIKQLSLKNKWYPFESQSAFKEGRPIFNQLIADIESGAINAILVWHANRISRNYGDGGKFVQLMSDGKLKVVLTPHGIFENTPRDREYLMTEFTRATRSSDDKSDAVKRGNRTKLKAGYIPAGRLAEGFLHAKNTREEMINIADPDRLPLIQNAIKLVLDQTHTPKEALAVLNEDWGYRTKKTRRTGNKSLSNSTWYKLLSDPKYFYGELRRSEGIFNAADDFPRPFSIEDYGKVQVILGKKSARRRTKKDWAYTGLGITCGGCSGTVIMDEKWQIICSHCKTKFAKAKDRDCCTNCGILIAEMKQPKILHYTWLIGNHKLLPDGTKCKQPALSVANFEQQVDALLLKMEIPEGFTNWAIKWLQKQHEVEVKDRTTVNNSLQNLYTNTQKQIDQLLDMRLKNLVSDEEYQQKKDLLLLEKKEINEKLGKTDERANNWLELSEKTFNFATYSRYWFNNGTIQQKREILSTLGSNLMIKDRILSLYLHKPFTIISEMQEKIDVLLDLFEPEELTDKSSYSNTSSEVIPNLLSVSVWTLSVLITR